MNETRARVFVAERYYKDANRLIASVIQTFEKGSEFAMLADALTLQGVIWARLGLHDSSIHILRYAMTVAQDSGAYSNAGLAALTLIEEHGKDRLSEAELYSVYRRIDELLKDTEDAEEIARLRACAKIVMRRLYGVDTSDKGFVLPKVLREQEAKFISEALEAEHGIVSHAAKRLGIRHQTLIRTLQTRHRQLIDLRTPAQPRRKRTPKR